MINFNAEKKWLLNNPPKTWTGWVERTCEYGNKTVTLGRKYKIRGYFRYLNTYGEKGWKYPKWDEFITIKNDFGYTVKMNATGFTPCTSPLTDIQKLEKRLTQLEKHLNEGGKQ